MAKTSVSLDNPLPLMSLHCLVLAQQSISCPMVTLAREDGGDLRLGLVLGPAKPPGLQFCLRQLYSTSTFTSLRCMPVVVNTDTCIQQYQMADHQDTLHVASADAPNALIPLEMPRADEEQIGGGCCAPSPPPVQTPTCLCTIVKATTQDSGLVCDAEMHCRKLPTDKEPQSVECASVLFCDATEYLPFPHEGQGKQRAVYELTISLQFVEHLPASKEQSARSTRAPASKGDLRPLASKKPPPASNGGPLPQILPPCIGELIFLGECSMADLF